MELKSKKQLLLKWLEIFWLPFVLKQRWLKLKHVEIGWIFGKKAQPDIKVDSWSLKLLARTGWERISLVSFFHWCLLEEIVAVVGKGTELLERVFLQFCSLKCSSYSAFTLTPNKFYTRFILNVKFSAWGVIFAQLPIFNFLH